MRSTITDLVLQSCFFLLLGTRRGADAHGYVASPRARNFVAYQDGVYSGRADDVYPKDSDPHSLNKGGTLAQCGTNGAKTYDYPLSTNGNLMPANPQMQYSRGQIIDIDIILTAHHKGHFLFNACPIQHGDIPTGDCFDSHPLEYVSDPLYGAPKDANYPNRAYIAPRGVAKKATVGLTGDLFQFRMKLPDDLVGGLVLLQWHYLTANSCAYEGYSTYPFPSSWGTNNGQTMSVCPSIPPDGSGLPEQFWNCAEISVRDGPVSAPTMAPAPVPPTGPTGPSPTRPTGPSPTRPTGPSPTRPTGPSPTTTEEGTCGDGQRGNGRCPTNVFGSCCSKWGFCGTTHAHCNSAEQQLMTAPTQQLRTPPSSTSLSPISPSSPVTPSPVLYDSSTSTTQQLDGVVGEQMSAPPVADSSSSGATGGTTSLLLLQLLTLVPLTALTTIYLVGLA